MVSVTPLWDRGGVKPLRIAGFDGTVVMVWPVDGWESTTVEVITPDGTQTLHLRPFSRPDLAGLRDVMAAAVLEDRVGDALVDDALLSLAVEEVDGDRLIVSISAVLDDERDFMRMFPTSRLAVWNLAMDVGAQIGEA
jgi:hypothetical protein